MSDVVVTEVRFDDPVVQALLAEWNDELDFAPNGGSPVDAGDFGAPDGTFLLAVSGEAPFGCGGLRRLTATTGEVKRVFVRRAASGHGVGRALMSALERRARERGLRAFRLDTDGGAPAALALFRSCGYEPIGDYNGTPYAWYWFEKHLAPPARERA